MTPLVLLFALAFLVSVDIRILTPVLLSISSSLGATPGVLGLAMTSYSFAYGTGQLFYGPLSDRMGRMAVVRAAGLGFSLCTALSALAMTTWQFIAARFVAGAFAGAVIPLTPCTSATRSRTTNARRIDAGASTRVTGPLTAPVHFWDFLRLRRAQLTCLAVFLEGFLLWGGATYLAAFGTHRHALDQFTVGLLIALLGVGTMAGGLCMAPVHHRLSENAVAGMGGALMGAAFLLLIPR